MKLPKEVSGKWVMRGGHVPALPAGLYWEYPEVCGGCGAPEPELCECPPEHDCDQDTNETLGLK